jgi:C-terminal peptidase prc
MIFLLLACLLPPVRARAELATTVLKSIRDSAAAPAVGEIVPVKVRVIPGPAARVPSAAPRLDKARLRRLAGRLGKAGAPPEEVRRLEEGLEAIDIHFVDPIPAKRWALILSDIGALAEKEGGEGRDWGAVVDRMLQKALLDLKEPHSAYLAPAQARALLDSAEGKLVGIGAGVFPDPQGVRISIVLPGSGAQKAGLQAGDVIASIAGEPAAGLSVAEVTAKAAGLPGTSVELGLLRSGSPFGPVAVERLPVAVPDAFFKMAAPGVGYVYVLKFQKDTGEKVLRFFSALRAQGARALVLDLRSNPGGLGVPAALIASELLPDGAGVLELRRQGGLAARVVAEGDGEFSDVPVAVLVNAASASSSEVLAAALRGRRAGCVVVGGRTFGKGTEQTALPQKGGRLLKITENRWYTPEGSSVDARHDPETGDEIPGTGGIVPDFAVDVPSDQAALILRDLMLELVLKPVPEPRTPDPVLEKAIEALSTEKP